MQKKIIIIQLIINILIKSIIGKDLLIVTFVAKHLWKKVLLKRHQRVHTGEKPFVATSVEKVQLKSMILLTITKLILRRKCLFSFVVFFGKLTFSRSSCLLHDQKCVHLWEQRIINANEWLHCGICESLSTTHYLSILKSNGQIMCCWKTFTNATM